MKGAFVLILVAAASGPRAAAAADDGWVRELESRNSCETAAFVEKLVEPGWAPPVFHGPRSLPAVALSFDDGPSRFTPQVLAVLKKHRVQATFFMVGEMVDAFPDWARAVVGAGHELGNHTYSHLNWCSAAMDADKGREKKFAAEVDRAAASIRSATGVDSKLLRMP